MSLLERLREVAPEIGTIAHSPMYDRVVHGFLPEQVAQGLEQMYSASKPQRGGERTLSARQWATMLDAFIAGANERHDV